LIKKYNLIKKSQTGRIYLYRLTDGIDGGRVFSQNLVKKNKLVSSGTYLFGSNHIRSPSPSPQLNQYNSPTNSPKGMSLPSSKIQSPLVSSLSSSSNKKKKSNTASYIQNDIPKPKKKHKTSFYLDENDNKHENYNEKDDDTSYIIQPRLDSYNSISHFNNLNNNNNINNNDNDKYHNINNDICTISDSDEYISDKDNENITNKLFNKISHSNNNNNKEICTISDSDGIISDDNRIVINIYSSKSVFKESDRACSSQKNNLYDYDSNDGDLMELNSSYMATSSKDLDTNRSIIQSKDVSSPFIVVDDDNDVDDDDCVLINSVKKSHIESHMFSLDQNKSVVSPFFIDDDYDKTETLTKSILLEINSSNNNNNSNNINQINTVFSPCYINDDSEECDISFDKDVEINLISPISNQINTSNPEDCLSKFIDTLSDLLPTEEEKDALINNSSSLSSYSSSSLNLNLPKNINPSLSSQSTSRDLLSSSSSSSSSLSSKYVKKSKIKTSSPSSAASTISSPPCNYDPSTISLKTSLFQSKYGGVIPIGNWWKEEHDWKQYCVPPSWFQFHDNNNNDPNNNRVIDHFNLILLVDNM
jgi:hypothetical protein